MSDTLSAPGGELRRFVLEQLPIRGFWMRLAGAWRALRAYQHYAPQVEALLGQAVTATGLLAATLKFRGRLTLQAQGAGLVELLVAQCNDEFELRALARTARAVPSESSFHDLLGADGRLSVTLDGEDDATRYEGIVALQGDSLATCLEGYFRDSEQLPTRLLLHADAAQTCGLLLQQMPSSAAAQADEMARQEVWEGLQARLAQLSPAALASESVEDVLRQVCAEQDCRLFAAQPVRFGCRCSAQRVAGLLRTLEPAELWQLLEERGAVTVTCEFCGRPYRFDALEVQRLLMDAAPPEVPPRLN